MLKLLSMYLDKSKTIETNDTFQLTSANSINLRQLKNIKNLLSQFIRHDN